MGLFSTECGNCGSKEHETSDCPHGFFSSECSNCGSKEHATSDCPHGFFSSECANCGSKDHATNDCPHGFISSECGNCGSKEHSTSNCPHGLFSSECGICGSNNHATSDCPHGWGSGRHGTTDSATENGLSTKSDTGLLNADYPSSSNERSDIQSRTASQSKSKFGSIALVTIVVVILVILAPRIFKMFDQELRGFQYFPEDRNELQLTLDKTNWKWVILPTNITSYQVVYSGESPSQRRWLKLTSRVNDIFVITSLTSTTDPIIQGPPIALNRGDRQEYTFATGTNQMVLPSTGGSPLWVQIPPQIVCTVQASGEFEKIDEIGLRGNTVVIIKTMISEFYTGQEESFEIQASEDLPLPPVMGSGVHYHIRADKPVTVYFPEGKFATTNIPPNIGYCFLRANSEGNGETVIVVRAEQNNTHLKILRYGVR